MTINKPAKSGKAIAFFPADLSFSDDGTIMFYIAAL